MQNSLLIRYQRYRWNESNQIQRLNEILSIFVPVLYFFNLFQLTQLMFLMLNKIYTTYLEGILQNLGHFHTKNVWDRMAIRWSWIWDSLSCKLAVLQNFCVLRILNFFEPFIDGILALGVSSCWFRIWRTDEISRKILHQDSGMIGPGFNNNGALITP